VYEDGNLLICPECAYEFSVDDLNEQEEVVKDANGNTLVDGDTVSVIKDLKIKGTPKLRIFAYVMVIIILTVKSLVMAL